GILAGLAMGVVVVSAAIASHPASAQSVTTTALDRYLDGLVSWRADLSQTTVDARGRRRPAQEGTLTVQRPGRFRWEIRAAGASVMQPAQVMVADGRNLWFYDADLEQVTVKPSGGALTATPAMLLAGTVPLREAFTVAAAGRRDGLDWVRATPRGVDAEFREVRFGFVGLELRRLEIDDRLGQRVTLAFRDGQRNPVIPAGVLRFDPPAGADLIGKPLP
ncbi:MAG: outer membrane lipoprotein carrier protein LolA, partial [Gammaproteobacteria bacterium]